ncbi:peptide deformylase [Streptomyces albireticuli]|uniref:Peptide deformylase n=1 Tax=Streptomyces albireticuli TaxID=1940 RepID=A0A2A2D1Z4_9ACTN|nr:peptide deformylase [Streptomyces albireticuli]MCD9145872.1 peptide deformylase [Streptomyces albireticuli]MCD9166141.1 peptide deformylase [Streptomyces albireticuli]MCD9189643.1 peptide deformylase [Streptomyces albireticuli]PAU45352.1 formylmethionine deformylase [Streptomyces albireticuli]
MAAGIPSPMQAAGIVQEGDPVLLTAARPFVLPAEAEEASRVVEELKAAADRVAALHDFAKGMGIAAPQIGIGRAAALVQPPEGEPLTLLNPVVVEESAEMDEQFEGCLSFFGVRGLVPRPLMLRVAYETADGQRCVSAFERGLARLVAHEVDHLAGKLYRARMRPGVEPISVAEYRGTGAAWEYDG